MEKRIVNDTNMEQFEMVNTTAFEIGFYTQKAPEKTTPNEDSLGFVVNRNKAVLMVADGVGGAPKGEEASSTAIESIANAFSKDDAFPKEEADIRNLMLDSIEKANQSLLTKNNGARTTLTACEIHNKQFRSFQVGDSSVIVCGQKGLLKFKATEHSPTGFAVEAGLLKEKDAMTHPERHLVSNVVGEATMHIEMGPLIELAAHDTILMASDGLFDNYLAEQLIEVIRKESLTEVMQNLVALCKPMLDPEARKKLNKTDDVSLIVCRQR